MNRNASAAVQAEWAKAQNAPVHLLEAYFDTADGGTVRLNDSYMSIVWGGNTYSAVGDFLDFDSLTESMEQRIADVAVRLSGVSQTFIAVFLQRQYIDRRLVIYQAFHGSADALVVDPFAIHDGRMDEMRVVEDPASGTSTIEVASRDRFADFERLSGRHTNSHDQNLWFPTDRGFDALAALNSRSFSWGHVKEPAATGLGAALTRFIYSPSWGQVFRFR